MTPSFANNLEKLSTPNALVKMSANWFLDDTEGFDGSIQNFVSNYVTVCFYMFGSLMENRIG